MYALPSIYKETSQNVVVPPLLVQIDMINELRNDIRNGIRKRMKNL